MSLPAQHQPLTHSTHANGERGSNTPRKQRVVRFYESTLPSGNCYKVELLMSHLGIKPEETLLVDIMTTPPQTRTPAFLKMNSNGRVPVVELADGTVLAESNAILYYLAEGTPYWPSDTLARTRVLQWMFFEQYSHEPYIAVLKFWTKWGGLHNKSQQEIDTWKVKGQAALQVMEEHLKKEEFFGGSSGYSIADIALFAYTQSAGEVGFDMDAVPAVQKWLERVRQQPGFVQQRRETVESTFRP